MSDARRLLVITYCFGPDGPVGGLRWGGITKYLARLGWEVWVITAAPAGTGTTAGARVESCPRLATFMDGCRLLRRLILGRSPRNASARPPASEPVGGGGGGVLRELQREVAAFLAFPDESRGWMLRAAWRARSVIRRFRPQVVVSSGPPHSAHLVAGMATIGSTARWLIDLRDPWAGPLTKAWTSHARIGSRTFRALSPLLERLTFGAADGVITNTRQLAEALTATYPHVPVACVPNGVDAELLPSPPAARQRYPGLGVAYAGRLYGGRDLGPVMQALRIFLQRHPEAAAAGSKLRIVGGAADAPDAQVFHQALAAAGVAQHVEVLGWLSRADALEVVSRSRLALVLAQEQELQIPAKLYEAVAMGIPTLVVATTDSATGVEGNRLGAVVCDSRDIDGIVRVLEQLWRARAPERSQCPVPITYDALAPLVDQILVTSGRTSAARQAVTASP